MDIEEIKAHRDVLITEIKKLKDKRGTAIKTFLALLLLKS